MYLQLTMKICSEKADLLEENFYLIEGLSWEREDATDSVIFKFYFPITLDPRDQQKIEQIEKIGAQFPEVTTEYSLIERENWEIIWKYHFKPLAVGRSLLILPNWEEPEENTNRIPIYIEPGQAFGTGHHATTQLMLENLEIYFEELCKETESPLVLDLGCGTGILAIATAKLCPSAVIYAVDIDELALEATEKNAKLNKVEERIIILPSLPRETDLKFDLILANIGFKELRSLAGTLRDLSRDGKTILLLSGVLRDDIEELWQIYRTFGFKKLKIQHAKEWSLLALRA